MCHASETRQREENTMTNVRIQIPTGFTAAADAPSSSKWADRFEVLYVPHDRQTHFESGVAKYDRERENPAYRWKTVDGDNVGDSGRTVFAWRRQQDEMEIVRLAPEPTLAVEPAKDDRYQQAVMLLAHDHLKLELAGEHDTRPSGVGLTAALFHLPIEEVVADYRAAAKTLRAADRR
jgi:hypothetical protein